MVHSRNEVRGYLADLAVYALLHSLLAFSLAAVSAVMAFDGRQAALRALWTALPFFAMSVSRRNLSSPVLFFPLQFVLAAIPLFLPLSLAEKIACTALLAIGAVYSVSTRVTGDMKLNFAYACVSMGVNGVLLVLGAGLDFGGAEGILTAWAVVQALCWLVCRQTSAIDDSLKTSTKNRYAFQIGVVRFNNILLLGLVGVVLLVLLASPLLPTERAFSLLSAGFVGAVRFLIGLGRDGEAAEKEADVVQETLVSDGGGMPMLEEQGEPHWLVQLIGNILQYVLFAAVILLLVWALAWAALALYKKLRAARLTKDGDFREFIAPDLSLGGVLGALRGLRFSRRDFGSGEGARIRRAYFKRVRKQIKTGLAVSNADTCGQILNRSGEAEDFAQLTEQYQRVRYGQVGEDRG